MWDNGNTTEYQPDMLLAQGHGVAYSWLFFPERAKIQGPVSLVDLCADFVICRTDPSNGLSAASVMSADHRRYVDSN